MYTVSARAHMLNLLDKVKVIVCGPEKHFKFATSCNQTLQETFEFVKFSDYLPLN